MRRRLLVLAFALASTAAVAVERGAAVIEHTLYIAPDVTSAKLGKVPRGREINILETSPGWLRVFVVTAERRDVSGWIEDKGVVRATTPNGDQILFGAAVDLESEAQARGGRQGIAEDAGRLYYRLAEYFPKSPLAGEALYRAADIKWQLDSVDVWSRPSARETEARMRPEIDEQLMKEVRKKFPGTKWADLAAYTMLDNKICGSWQGEPKCPEKEAEMYEKYAAEHPKSPKAAEALYNAAWRQSALIEIYRSLGDSGKSAAAKAKALALAQRIASAYPEGDYAARAHRLTFLIQQNIPTYARPAE